MRRIATAAVALAVIAPLTQAQSATSSDGAGARLSDVNTERLRERVTVGDIMAHERVFQRIANQHGGTRASGTTGYGASARYVMRTLEEAGYRVRKQVFTFPFWRNLSDPVLQQITPTPTDYETATFTYSGSGDVTGQLIPTNDVEIPPQVASTSGCEPGDFEPAPAEPAVALIQRGTCTFEIKAANAEAAGYDAVIIFNEGQEGRTELLTGTLGVPFDIPVVGLSFADGQALYQATQQGEVTVRVFAETETNLEAKTSNILATSRSGNPEKTFVVGAHLDSVVEGPGINDNGSGVSALLEIAQEMADLHREPRQRVRFAFWGAEESGLLGSEHYVNTISNRGLSQIFANLNFDMVGSPNYARFVYDGDGSDSDPAGPAGSGQIEDLFVDYFDEVGLSSDPTPFSGRSDYGPFIEVGIPAGGLFTGAEGIKTEEQEAEFGGEAGVAYDPCYHQACDTIYNVNTKAIREMSDAAAHAVWTLARSRTGFFGDGSFRTMRQEAVTPRRSHTEAPRR
jgi:Zn-dependent M28 family amino/carboxypeptidase